VDHSSLTALTSAMYIDEAALPWQEITDRSDASDKSGLYIKNRGGQTIRVNIPRDCIAIQTGQALEISSRYVMKL
jgi:hypothetical protein